VRAAWGATRPGTPGSIERSPSRSYPSTSPQNPRHGNASSGKLARFSSLNHPHIRTLYDIGRQDGIDYLVMEFEGSSSRFEEKSELLRPQLVGIVQRMDEKRLGV
jgi:hypothetical protein